MKVHTKTQRTHHGAARLRWWEWLFLIAGLVLVDIYIWVNTSAVLWQAYEERAFGLKLRPPGPPSLLKPPTGQLPPLKPLPPSKTVGRLEIPRLHLAVMVQEGVDARTLRRAVGHIPGTALPGTAGNVGLAGHRDTFFRPLRNIHPNDVIDFQTTNGKYEYVVQSTRIVSPRDVSVLAPTALDTLTLVTCYPFYYVGSAPRRFVVRATPLVKPGDLTSSLIPDKGHSPERAGSPIR